MTLRDTKKFTRALFSLVLASVLLVLSGAFAGAAGNESFSSRRSPLTLEQEAASSSEKGRTTGSQSANALPVSFGGKSGQTEAAICFDGNGRQFTGTYNKTTKEYLLGNESLGLYVFSLEGKNYYAGANGVAITSPDNVFGNTDSEKEMEYGKATEMYRTLETVLRYYKKAYGAQGDKYLIGLYNDSYDDGNNSFATDDILWKGDVLPVGTVVGVISIGTHQDPGSIDLLAHEYMHRVEQNKVGLLYRGESGSIMEAYSDIFGELVEAGVTGRAPDWVHNGVRDLVHPAVHGYPEVYKGKYYVSNSTADNGAVHKNSTVLSHAAYLMYNGIDGNKAKRLDSKTLATLWLTALEKFHSRETFSQCAAAIYETAQTMGLSKSQVKCVAEAFSAAGLPVQ
ncbi:MAG: M4 family metallopeptidase [Clostridia bacterium]|nr:M4 family metallopeptidase [Clostridia bacterium]